MVIRGATQCWRKRGVRPDSPGDLSLEEGCEVPGSRERGNVYGESGNGERGVGGAVVGVTGLRVSW